MNWIYSAATWNIRVVQLCTIYFNCKVHLIYVLSLPVLFSPGHKNVVGDFSGVGQKLFVCNFVSLPEQAEWGYLAYLGSAAVSRKKMVFLCHTINPDNPLSDACNRP